jgi:chorismate synthase
VTSFVVRELSTQDEFRACVRLQQLVWGEDFGEIVPPAIQWVARKTGGIIAGAFDGGSRMLGFLFGITGFVDGRPLHWSDMLAVTPEARGLGIGTALKRHQRDQLLARGVREVRWTFDPLESRNAWVNFNHLGIVVREYIRDCYGPATSPLHVGLGTDRLVAVWLLDSDRVRRRMDSMGADSPGESATGAGGRDEGVEPAAGALSDLPVRIRIPHDIQALKRADPDAAVRWRETTREAFEEYLGRGYEAVDIERTAGETAYLLKRSSG